MTKLANLIDRGIILRHYQSYLINDKLFYSHTMYNSLFVYWSPTDRCQYGLIRLYVETL